MRPGVVYGRVSTGHQSNSLDVQESKNGDYCRLADIEIVRTFTDEAISGTIRIADRPGGRAMLAYLMARGCPVKDVVVAKLDRLGRNATDVGRVIEDMLAAGIRLHIVDPLIDCGTPMGKFTVQLLAAVAELEAANIRSRIRAVMEHKRANGKVTGTTPYGYMRSGDDLVEDPNQMPILLQIIRWREEGRSCERIAADLNAAGVPARSPAGVRFKQNGSWKLTTGKWSWRTLLLMEKGKFYQNLREKLKTAKAA